jgi:hypothetical protein
VADGNGKIYSKSLSQILVFTPFYYFHKGGRKKAGFFLLTYHQVNVLENLSRNKLSEESSFKIFFFFGDF